MDANRHTGSTQTDVHTRRGSRRFMVAVLLGVMLVVGLGIGIAMMYAGRQEAAEQTMNAVRAVTGVLRVEQKNVSAGGGIGTEPYVAVEAEPNRSIDETYATWQGVLGALGEYDSGSVQLTQVQPGGSILVRSRLAHAGQIRDARAIIATLLADVARGAKEASVDPSATCKSSFFLEGKQLVDTWSSLLAPAQGCMIERTLTMDSSQSIAVTRSPDDGEYLSAVPFEALSALVPYTKTLRLSRISPSKNQPGLKNTNYTISFVDSSALWGSGGKTDVTTSFVTFLSALRNTIPVDSVAVVQMGNDMPLIRLKNGELAVEDPYKSSAADRIRGIVARVE